MFSSNIHLAGSSPGFRWVDGEGPLVSIPQLPEHRAGSELEEPCEQTPALGQCCGADGKLQGERNAGTGGKAWTLLGAQEDPGASGLFLLLAPQLSMR